MLLVEVLKSDEEIVNALRKEFKEDCTVVTSKKFHGLEDTVQLMIPVASVILPFITTIIVKQIESKKFMKIKVNGIEIEGLTQKNAMKLLEKNLDSSNEDN